jgi:hypothetical protein
MNKMKYTASFIAAILATAFVASGAIPAITGNE